MTKRAFKTADMPLFSTIGDLAISPIGTRVAFSRQQMDLQNNRTTSNIWLAVCYTKFAKRLTVGPSKDCWPVWSPDGLRLAFVSDRSGKRQIYLMDPDGGEPSVIATKEEPASAPVWSPDGTRIAFCAKARTEAGRPRYPGAPEEGSDSKTPPVVITTLHHKLDGNGFFQDDFSHIFVIPAQATEPGETACTDRVTSGRYNHQAPVWSADGKKLLCIANRVMADDDPFWERHLWLVDVDTGSMKRVFTEDYRVQEAAWSADGRLAVLGLPHELSRLSDIDDVFLLEFDPDKAPYSIKDAQNLTAALDRNPGMVAPSETRLRSDRNLIFSADGESLFFTVSSEGTSHIWRASVADGMLEKKSPGQNRAVGSPTLSDNGWLAYTSSEPSSPDEIFVLSPKGVEHQITRVNAVKDDFDFVDAQRLVYKADDGWDIEGWYIRPSSQQGPDRTVINVHGGPHGMFGYGFSFLHQLLVSAGNTVFYANPRASSGYGKRFHNAVEGDWGGKDFGDLMSGLDVLVENGIASPKALGITGWSFGGYMTCWAIGQTPRFRAAVAGACISNQHDRYGTADIGPEDVETSVHHATPWTDPMTLINNSPLTYAGNVQTPLLLLCGELDLRCPISQTEQMYIALKRQQKPSVFVRYPEEYHGLQKPLNIIDRYQRTLSWFDHYMGPVSTESDGGNDDV